ncbi:ABC transporter substrate-binding protein [Gottschalkia purinilytica]|uniref:Endolytic murein transglycosylase n=1 Tax=Gottschalkia purinilytica TaxID=1503 RepID=A0A0L0WEL2_GOTPU|nr:endolytic transglycosylase MltG [Gottschalkia purinilytica]KNF09876.1 ABC transporter substrate-binding protein [Gottschalkia purinilytica]
MSGTLFKENKKKSISKKKIAIISSTIAVIVGIVGGKYYVDRQKLAVANENIQKISITIPQGSNTQSIAKILKDNGLIRNEFIFRITSKLEKKDSSYKAGVYLLSNGMNQDQIMKELISGGASNSDTKFTIPEGFELKQIAEKLSKQGIVNKEKFLSLTSKVSNFSSEYEFLKEVPQDSSLEGFLYPDTYEIYKGATEEEIIKKMLNNFNKIYTNEIKNKGKQIGLDTNKIITLASIIEREAKIDSERPMVSAVFHNRLKKNIMLESCATVQYILGERKEVLTYKDLKIKSEYNTYLNRGLPPSPIASPGIKSIMAAVDPANVDYLFFVANKDGSHTFTKTYEEHIKAQKNN